jgi:DNA-binding CsgD family transcriptional regulator/tetratricopeptide (TPR) repeat protein
VLTLDAREPLDPDDALVRARRAQTLGRIDDAIRLASVAASARPDDVTTLCALAELLIVEGRGREAEVLLARLAPTTDTELALWAMTRASNLFYYLEDVASAFGVLDDAIERLDTTPWAAELRGLTAVFELFLGRPHRALEIAQPHLEGSDGRNLVEAITAAAPALVVVGRAEQGAALAQRGVEERQALGDQPMLSGVGIHLVTRALALGDAGQIEASIDLARLVYAGAAAENLRDGMLWSTVVLGRALIDAGRLAEAVDTFSESVDLAVDLGLVAHRRWALAGLTMAHSMLGDRAGARAAASDLTLSPIPVAHLMQSEPLCALGWAAATEGDLGGARRHLLRAADQARDTDQAAMEVHALHDLVRLGATDEIDRLTTVGGAIEGPLAAARVAHGRAFGADDADALADASMAFERLGALLMAAESAMQGAAAARRSGERRLAGDLTQRSDQLRSRCQGASTPALARHEGLDLLTSREREVAHLASTGAASKEIAGRLGISSRTVDNLLLRAYRKLGVHGRDQLQGVFDR